MPRSPGGTAPPKSAALAQDLEIDLEPLAAEICRRYRAEFGDEDARYGAAGGAWCIHDNLYLLAWAIDDVRLGGAHFLGNVGWLRRVLESRGFPVERLARDLELAGEVVAEAVPDGSTELVDRFKLGAELVRGDATREEPPADAPVRDAYVQALLAARPAAARAVVQAALEAGLPARSVYLDVLQPALHEVGRLWELGQASVAQEHLATATTQALLHHVAGSLPHLPSVGRSAIVTGTEGELHGVGVRFVADFLEADGWSVLELGPSTPTADLVDLADRSGADLVGLSTTLTSNLARAAEAVAALRALSRPPLIVVGGSAYRGDEALAARLGADVFARDAGSLGQLLRERR